MKVTAGGRVRVLGLSSEVVGRQKWFLALPVCLAAAAWFWGSGVGT